MFGWVLIKKSELKEIRAIGDMFKLSADRYKDLNSALVQECLDLKAENKRLFDYHNKKLTKPRRDKHGKLRNPDGTFAKRVK